MSAPTPVEPTPGRKVTRRVESPAANGMLSYPSGEPGERSAALAAAHARAVREHGSESGFFHAFDPATDESAGVYTGRDGFPDGAVVSPLSWGRITDREAARLLASDGCLP